jgi:outer membrane protein assembly factor BamB
MKRLLLIPALWLLASCTVPDWMGNKDAQEQKLTGERIAVLDYRHSLQPDPLRAQETLALPAPQLNRDFLYETSLQTIGADQLGVRGLEEQESASVGEGYGWKTPVVPQPVVAGELIYAMDARGHLSAHRLKDLGEVVWRSDAAVREDEPEMAGGGLSVKGERLFVTTGYGDILALNAADGTLLWHKKNGIPFRAPATPGETLVFVVSIDNKLHAYDMERGRLMWTHQGIRETALYLGSMTPAVQNGIVVVGYASGELVALRAEDGFVLWSDTLVIPRRTSASANLNGIDATPLMRDGVVYALSNNGLMTANRISTGRGLWDMELSGYQTPWIAQDYLIVLTSGGQLVAVNRGDKSIKWVTDLRREEEDTLPHYTAPMVINGAVLLVNNRGEARLFDLNSGVPLQEVGVDKGVLTTPVVAQGALYLLNNEARLTRYE